MINRNLGRHLVALALSTLFAGGFAYGQTMYRCGATYQDRPCSGVDSKPVGSHVRQAAGQSTGAASIDPVCAARGTSAQKLMWEKESGRTLDEQLAKPNIDPGFIRNVYGRRGSSLDVRRGIEAECVKEMEQAAATNALLKAAGKLQPNGVSPGTPTSSGDVAVLPPQPSGEEIAAKKAAAKAATCADLKAELNELNQSQRDGGDAARMDVLAARVRDTQSRKRAAGC